MTVKKTGQPFRGPFANSSGALVISELHMDGSRERKTFAPGYGEFFTSGGGDTEALALAVPADAADGAMPAAVRRLDRAATTAYAAGMHGDAVAIDRAAKAARAAWRSLGRAGACRDCYAPCSNGRCCGSALRTRPSARGSGGDWSDPTGAGPAGSVTGPRTPWTCAATSTPGSPRCCSTCGSVMSGPCAGTSSRSTTSATGCVAPSARDSAPEVDLALEELLDAINEVDLLSVREVARDLRHLIR